MKGEKRELWMELCAQAADEHPKKLMKLIDHINQILAEKEARLQPESNQKTA